MHTFSMLQAFLCAACAKKYGTTSIYNRLHMSRIDLGATTPFYCRSTTGVLGAPPNSIDAHAQYGLGTRVGMAAGPALTSSYPLSYGGSAECCVTLALFTDVTNCAHLRSQASAGLVRAALLCTTLVRLSCKYIKRAVMLVRNTHTHTHLHACAHTRVHSCAVSSTCWLQSTRQ